MKIFISILVSLISISNLYSQSSDYEIINEVMNNWHKSASEADADEYFSAMSDDAIYIGTDATELWTKKQFKAFAKPYFYAGKAWDFKTISRNIYFSKDKNVAWFDELLETWMGVCRGSGVLEKTDGNWKIQHYHLSVTVPNSKIEEFIKITE